MPNIKQLIQWVGGGLITLLVALVSYNVKQVAGSITELDGKIERSTTAINARIAALELWQAETKGNRFTSKDGADMLARINEVQRDVSKLPQVFPPTWVSEDLKAIKAEVQENGKAIAKLEASVQALRTKI